MDSFSSDIVFKWVGCGPGKGKLQGLRIQTRTLKLMHQQLNVTAQMPQSLDIPQHHLAPTVPYPSPRLRRPYIQEVDALYAFGALLPCIRSLTLQLSKVGILSSVSLSV